MTFQTSYAKLLSDSKFGNLKQRREHAKQMYVEGMKRALEIVEDNQGPGVYLDWIIEKAIAEESK